MIQDLLCFSSRRAEVSILVNDGSGVFELSLTLYLNKITELANSLLTER